MRRCLGSLVLACALLLALGADALAGGRLYIRDSDTDTISGFQRNEDGSLTPIPGSPFPGTGGPDVTFVIDFGFTPNGDVAAGSTIFKGGVQGFSVDGAGALRTTNAIPSRSSESMAISPDGRFLYQATREFGGVPSEGIRTFGIEPSGNLAPAGPPTKPGTSFRQVAISPDGRFLFAPGSGGGIDRFAIGPDGMLTLLGNTPAVGVGTLAVAPDRSLLLAAVSAPNGVASFTIGADGSLAQNGPPAQTADSTMFFGIAPDGRHLFMPDGNADAIVVAAIAPDGQLSVVGSMPTEDDPESVAVSPDGRFLYWMRKLTGADAGLRTAAIGAGGSLTPLPFFAPTEMANSGRIVLQPEPPPVAALTARASAPGAPSAFDAGASIRAARFAWDFGDGTSLADGGPTPRHTYAKAGVYAVTLTVSGPSGCSVAHLYTGQSTVCPGSPAAKTTVVVDTPPGIGALKATPKRFPAAGAGGKRRGSKAGTTLRYRLSEPAKLLLTFERRIAGRLVGRKCKRETPRNAKRKRCSLFTKLGTRTARGKAGANVARFDGRLKGKALAPGPYRVTAVATDKAGGRSEPRRAAFRVIAD